MLHRRMTARPPQWQLNPASPLTRGLVFFGGGRYAGTTYYNDACWRGNHAMLVGFSGAGDTPSDRHVFDGLLRRCVVSFDGSDDYVCVPYFAASRPTGQIAFAAWLHADWPNYTTNCRAVSTLQGGGYGLGVNRNANELAAFVYRNGSYGTALSLTRSSLSSGWHHFAGTYDGRFTRLFIDGVQVGIDDAGSTYSISYSVANSLVLGAEAGAANTPDLGLFFGGRIGDAMLWDRALPEWELVSLADSTNVDLTVGGVPLILDPCCVPPMIGQRGKGFGYDGQFPIDNLNLVG